MNSVRKKFEELKRKAYLTILPLIFFSSLLTFSIRASQQEFGFEFYINGVLLIAFLATWYAVFIKKKIVLFEYILLFLLVAYYLIATWLSLHNLANHRSLVGNGMFIIWLPLILIYLFTILKRTLAIYLSLSIFVLSIVPAILHIKKLDAAGFEFFFQLYIATFIFILFLIATFKLFHLHAELQLI